MANYHAIKEVVIGKFLQFEFDLNQLLNHFKSKVSVT